LSVNSCFSCRSSESSVRDSVSLTVSFLSSFS
jgi:hypothetical protein